MGNLYIQEQDLLKKLTETKSVDQQEAIKNIIGRINNEMREIEEENKKPSV